MPASDFAAILGVLSAEGVEFIVVGGVSAVLQGAPVTTFDLDVVHSRKADNVQRLMGALEKLDAHYRSYVMEHRRPGASHLSLPGYQLLMTRYGPLDLLGMIGKSHTYEDLFPETAEIEAAPGIAVRVMNLEQLIAIKAELQDEKDLAMLPVLKRTLEEKRRR